MPGSFSFQKYHLKHHSNQGVYELDADIPSRWEARLIGRSAFMKALWLLLYPLFQSVRAFRVKDVPPLDVLDGDQPPHPDRRQRRRVPGVGADVVRLSGARALLLDRAAPARRALDPAPLSGGRGRRQETFSYYGKLNLLTFNVGYHNEHHDFPSIAWIRLPRIRAIAPEFYEELTAHTSWTKLLFRFLFDPEVTLYSRMTRESASGHPRRARRWPGASTAA